MLTFDQNDASQTSSFVFPQWIVTPLANSKWLLVMSGVVIVHATCGNPSGWLLDTVRILPDFSAPFGFAGNDVKNNIVVLQAEQYATYGTLNAIFDANTSVDAGFGVNSFQPFFSDGERGIANSSGIDLEIAVRDIDASILRVGYQLMAVGKFVVTPNPPPK